MLVRFKNLKIGTTTNDEEIEDSLLGAIIKKGMKTKSVPRKKIMKTVTQSTTEFTQCNTV